MDIHDILATEHNELRAIIRKIGAQRASPSDALKSFIEELRSAIRSHFSHEEAYYRTVDKDPRFSDPGCVHQLRNDHAALLFGMESLLIRLKKKGPVAEWWEHFDKLMAVFLPHMKLEEDALFPEAERLLTAPEWQVIRQSIAQS
jgi:hemerythrin